MAVKLELVTGS